MAYIPITPDDEKEMLKVIGVKALDDLEKVKLICGNTRCEEFRQLKAVIDGKASY